MPKDSLRFGQFDYTAEGALARADIGLRGDIYDTLYQRQDYVYNPIGQLVSLADTTDVIGVTAGVGTDSLHFGQQIFYNDADSGYYNGRMRSSGYRNSDNAGIKDYRYYYSYNDLGWLESALRNESDTNAYSREFEYNNLGQRTRMIASGQTQTIDYVYNSTAGSSRLRRFTGMGTYDSMYYDILGNLVKDDYRDLDTLKYDYRNLLRYVYMESRFYSYYHDILRFKYDEGGQRIKKLYHYFSRYFDIDCNCPSAPTDSTMEGSVFGGGGMQMIKDPPEPDPCEGEYCPYAGHTEKLYLYDGGVLLATFNGYDQVIDVHVNGPTGRLATYYHNNDFELFFVVNDHLGNARILVDSTGQKMYYAYYPFGETIEASGSHGTEFQFTGKEREDHSGFEFDYFGARYYDPRIGSFTTIDKASQFASGYVYGGNNPLIGVDPDGNLFFLTTAFLLGAAFGGGSYAVTTDNFQLDKFLGYAAFGGLGAYSGAAVQGFSQVASNATASAVNSIGGKLIDNSPLGINFGFGAITEGQGWSTANPFKGGLLDQMSAASGWLALGEDLNRSLPDGKANGWDYDETDNTLTDPDGNVQTLDQQTLEEARKNPGDHYPVSGGEKIEPPLPHPPSEGRGTGMNIRFPGRGPGPGGLHLDVFTSMPSDNGPWLRFHWDAYASGLRNPGTMIQHVAFESLAHSAGGFVGTTLGLGVKAADVTKSLVNPVQRSLHFAYRYQASIRSSRIY